MYRFCRVFFGVIFSLFLLVVIVDYYFSIYESRIVENIWSNIYVDNVIIGVDIFEEGEILYEEVKEIFNSMFMNLRDWVLNVKEFYKFVFFED